MNERDHRFLTEYVNYSGLNHVVAAVALMEAGSHPDETAASVQSLVSHAAPDVARSEAERLNRGATVQSIVVARLLAELVSALEDVGALGWAIRERGRGLLSRYLKSSVGEVAQFFDLALQEPLLTLSDLLRFPSLAEIQERVAIEPSVIAAQCEVLRASLGELGRAYRDIGARVEASGANEGPDDRVHVLLGMGSDEAADKQDGVRPLLPDALNKLKHRFLLIQDVTGLAKLAGPPIRYAHYGRDPVSVRELFRRLVYVAEVGLNLAALVQVIEGVG